MHRTLSALAVLMLAGSSSAVAQSAQAPAGVYVSDKTHTSITWKGLHNGLSWYSARFTNFEIAVDFNEGDVAKSKVTATIDPMSIETDYARTRPAGNSTDFNSELATGERFLNGAKFPQIAFVSTVISKAGDKSGKMTGNLTFLGVTKPVTLDITYVGHRNDSRLQKHKIGFQAVGSFNRSDFGMPVGGSVGDEIKLEIHSELLQR